jgi:hypothetical protein
VARQKDKGKNDSEAAIGWEQRERGRKQKGRLDTVERASGKKQVNTRTSRGLSSDNKKIKFSSYIRKLRVEQLQIHI